MRGRTVALWLVPVGLSGVLASDWAASLRPDYRDFQSLRRITVTDTGDDGPGTLREALFVAANATAPVEILLPEGVIQLERALPRVGVLAPVAIKGNVGGGSTIDASASGAAACLEIEAPGSSATGVSFRNQAGTGVLVRAPRVVINDSEFLGSDIGVHILPPADHLVLQDNRFSSNRLGVFLDSSAVTAAVVRNHFAGNQSGVWAVSGASAERAEPVIVADNRFQSNGRAIVTGNVSIEIRNNDIRESAEDGVLMLETGARVVGNTIVDGMRSGIVADIVRDVVIQRNRIENHPGGVGILVRDATRASIASNVMERNAYGISIVSSGGGHAPRVEFNTLRRQIHDGIIVQGGEAVVRNNDVRTSGGFGLRFASGAAAPGPSAPAVVQTGGNVLSDNRAGPLRQDSIDSPRGIE